MVDVLAERGDLVSHLSNALHYGTVHIGHVPGLLRQLMVDDPDGWREYTIKGKQITHGAFEEFVTSPPLNGIGASSIDQLARLVADDNDLTVAIREARKAQGNRYKRTNSTPLGRTTKAATLDRLERERSDLRARVDAGEMSANAAAIEAGWRPRTATVRLDNPERIAVALRRRLDPDVLAQLKELL